LELQHRGHRLKVIPRAVDGFGKCHLQIDT
jgi:hypothetical protein